jgi:hypothetical protein
MSSNQKNGVLFTSISVVVVDEPHFSLSLSEHHTTVQDIRALENLPFMSHPTKGASSSLIFQSTSWEEMMKDALSRTVVLAEGPSRGKDVKRSAWRKRFLPPHRRLRGTRSIHGDQCRPGTGGTHLSAKHQGSNLSLSTLANIEIAPKVRAHRPATDLIEQSRAERGAKEKWDFLIGPSLAGTMLDAETGLDDDMSEVTLWSGNDENSNDSTNQNLCLKLVSLLGMTFTVYRPLDEDMSDELSLRSKD